MEGLPFRPQNDVGKLLPVLSQGSQIFAGSDHLASVSLDLYHDASFQGFAIDCNLLSVLRYVNGLHVVL